MMKRNRKILIAVAGIVSGLFMGSSTYANLLVYDGFEAGGATPAVGQYQSEPASTNGTNNNALDGQNPDRLGFDTTAWDNIEAVSSAVYPRVNSTGLSYTDINGLELLSIEGSSEVFRTGSGSGDKSASRLLDGTEVGVDINLYISALIQFASGSAGRINVVTTFDNSDDASGTRNNFIGFNDSGQLIAGTDSTSGNSGATVYAANTTHLVVAEFTQNGSSRPVNLWVNPTDLTDLGLPTHSWAANYFNDVNSPELVSLRVQGTATDNASFIMDEIRVGNELYSVLPTFVIPEPTSAALLGLAGIVLLRRRRQIMA